MNEKLAPCPQRGHDLSCTEQHPAPAGSHGAEDIPKTSRTGPYPWYVNPSISVTVSTRQQEDGLSMDRDVALQRSCRYKKHQQLFPWEVRTKLCSPKAGSYHSQWPVLEQQILGRRQLELPELFIWIFLKIIPSASLPSHPNSTCGVMVAAAGNAAHIHGKHSCWGQKVAAVQGGIGRLACFLHLTKLLRQPSDTEMFADISREGKTKKVLRIL